MTARSLAKTSLQLMLSRPQGPTLHDICGDLLPRRAISDDPERDHLRRFYRVALANPALGPMLGRAGLPALRDPELLDSLRDGIREARDADEPDWVAIGAPVADLLDRFPHAHPMPPAMPAPKRLPSQARLDHIARICADDLLATYRKKRYIPAYAAFNFAGDPDLHGQDFITALTGLEARTYRNATLLFNLARIFVLANPHLKTIFNRPWDGVAEPLWAPVQIAHRSAYYDAFFAESLLDYQHSGLASTGEMTIIRRAAQAMARFCVETSSERVKGPQSGTPYEVVTALVPPPHSRMPNRYWRLKAALGFGLYVPDCDTTACSYSLTSQVLPDHPCLDQPLLDLYSEYQVWPEEARGAPSVAINDTVDYNGGLVTWIESIDGANPYGNDLDPTLNLDVLEVAFRNHERWDVVNNAKRLAVVQGIISFHDRLIGSGAFADPRSHIYYLPELYVAYFGRTYEAFMGMPAGVRKAIDPDGRIEGMRPAVIAYARDALVAREMNPYDAALGLLALAKLDAPTESFGPALAVISERFGEGRKLGAFGATPLAQHPYRAYEWNKMKTPTRIIIGGPEVTSAFVLSALVHARKRMARW